MWVAGKNFYVGQSLLTPSSNASFSQINNHYLLNQLPQRLFFSAAFSIGLFRTALCLYMVVWF